MFKYIIFQRPDSIPSPVIFSTMEYHDRMANCDGRPVISAGFVIFTEMGAKCFGESESLKIKSREGDGKIIDSLRG